MRPGHRSRQAVSCLPPPAAFLRPLGDVEYRRPGDLAAVYSGLMGECREGRSRLSWEVKGDSERNEVEHRKYRLDEREKMNTLGRWSGIFLKFFVPSECTSKVRRSGSFYIVLLR